MSKLPLKVQVGIRDAWDNKEAPVQRAIQNLQDTIGVHMTVNPEWPLLHAELGDFYADKATFVPSVASVVESCCVALTTLADDEANTEWADALLEKTDNHIRLLLEVSKSREPSINWSSNQRGFVIAFPKSAIPSPSYMSSFFAGSLLKVFDENTTAAAIHRGDDNNNAAETESSLAADDWADVVVHSSGGPGNKSMTAGIVESLPSRSQHQYAQPVAEFEFLPDVGVIPRPDDLLLKPPYHLILRSSGSVHMEVECSHSPTLQFLCEYLKKWARTNHNNTTRPPFAEVKLHQSAFGLGVVYDRLTVTTESRYTVQTLSPTILLALIESTLGYKNVGKEAGSWIFRRDVEYRTSRY